MAYADGFLIPVPTKHLDAYRKISEKAGAVWMEHGALDYKECVGDDLNVAGMFASFPRTLGTKRGEAVVFSWILYRDRAHRDAVNKKVMADPRIMEGPKEMPFDMKRMHYGGFDVLVDMAPTKKTPAKTATKKKAAKKVRGR